MLVLFHPKPFLLRVTYLRKRREEDKRIIVKQEVEEVIEKLKGIPLVPVAT